MFRNKKWLVLTVLVLTGILVAACAPQPAAPDTSAALEEAQARIAELEARLAEAGDEEAIAELQAELEAAQRALEEAQAAGEAEGGEEQVARPTGEITTYQMGIYEDLTTTNFWAALDTEATTWNFAVIANYHPSLYGLAPQRFDFVPGLADGLPGDRTEEGDFVTIEVRIKEGLTWSDGEPLTAEDVVFTANTMQDFQLSSNWSTYNPALLDHVEMVDELTVKYFFTDVPGLGEWEFGASLMPIFAEHYWGPIVEEIRANTGLDDIDPADDAYAAAAADARTALYAIQPEDEPVYGPMMFGQWEPGAFAENVAREDYPDKGEITNLYDNGAYEVVRPDGSTFTAYGEPEGDPYLSVETGPFVPNVIFSIYGSQDAAVLALLDGEVDFVYNPSGLTPGLFEQVSASPDIVTVENPAYGFRYMAFNVRDDRPVTSNLAFRQAVATVIDQAFITDRILQGSAIPIWTVMPEANRFWYNSELQRWGYDEEGNNMDRAARVEAAVQILQEAGFSWEGGGVPTWNEDNQTTDIPGRLLMPDGTPVPDLELMAPSAGYDPMRATSAIWIEQWMRELGIPVTANLTGFNNISDRVFAIQDATWDMYILGWGLGNPAYPTYFESFWHCDYDTETTGGFNSPGYCSEEFDQLSRDFLAATDLETARQLAYEMQVVLNRDLPYIPLFTTPLLEAYRANVEYPFTNVLDGIQGLYGMQGTVKAYAAE
jgi:ABC-type transport system substrate-binding protein